MKITDYRVYSVAFPDPPLRNSTGVHEPYALRTLVRLQTDEGIVGWGECHGGSGPADRLESLREHMLGLDPFQLELLRQRVPDPRDYSPLEVACYDIQGQAVGRPVCDLLGGKLRDEVEFSAYLFYHFDCPGYGECLTPETLVEQARRFHRDYGFKSLKVKGGVLEPDQEIETIRQLRAALGPDYPLRLDPNAIWSVETSIRATNELEGLLEYMEDPTHGRDGMAEVAKHVNVPLATNMCVTAFEHFPEAVRLGSVQIVLSDHHYWGGLAATKQMAKICEVWGLGVSMHSNSHLGISLAAMTHVAAATPQIGHACDTHYPWIEADILDGGMWQFHDGCIRVPDAPGLGIRVDEDQVARMVEDYAKCGQTRRDDVGYMRKFVPDWQPMRPRW